MQSVFCIIRPIAGHGARRQIWGRSRSLVDRCICIQKLCQRTDSSSDFCSFDEFWALDKEQFEALQNQCHTDSSWLSYTQATVLWRVFPGLFASPPVVCFEEEGESGGGQNE